ncbi:glycosyltransferase [Candidatus Margulisiibacteriota bacterium]
MFLHKLINTLSTKVVPDFTPQLGDINGETIKIQINRYIEKITKGLSSPNLKEPITSVTRIIRDFFYNKCFKGDGNWNLCVEHLKCLSGFDPKAVRDAIKIEKPNANQFTLDEYQARLHAKLGDKGDKIINDLKLFAKYMKLMGKKKIVMINATSDGGGVAEMMPAFGVMLQELGLELEWHIIYPKGSGYLVTTKTFHNGIQQGTTAVLEENAVLTWKETSHNLAEILKTLNNDPEVAGIVVHDPQLLPFLEHFKNIPRIFQLHIDTSGISKAKQIWGLVKDCLKHLQKGEKALFQPGFIPEDLPENVFACTQYPGIGLCDLKNMPFSKTNHKEMMEIINKLNQEFGTHIDPTDKNKEYTVTGARIDQIKGLIADVRAFSQYAEEFPKLNQIVFGGYANDDFEGCEQYKLLKHVIDTSPYKDRIEFVVNKKDRDIGVLYHLASLYKLFFDALSLKEGFGLTATEALVHGVMACTSLVGGFIRLAAYKIFQIDLRKQSEKVDKDTVLYTLDKENNFNADPISIEVENEIAERKREMLRFRRDHREEYDKLYDQAAKEASDTAFEQSIASVMRNYIASILTQQIQRNNIFELPDEDLMKPGESLDVLSAALAQKLNEYSDEELTNMFSGSSIQQAKVPVPIN